jgi:archaellum component FlaC
MSPLTELEGCSEKFGKKLIGRTDMEDALKRLDKLTQEEARMAVAQNLKATHTVDESVRGVANMAIAIDIMAGVDDRVVSVDDRVARVDSRVARIDSRVARIDSRVARIDSRVARVDDRVVVVDDKVAEVLHGARVIFSQAWELSNLNRSDGKEAKQAAKKTADDVDLVKRSSSRNILMLRPTVYCR